MTQGLGMATAGGRVVAEVKIRTNREFSPVASLARFALPTGEE
jgi:hypothetical protein